jgi:hypothetical protein
MEWCSNTFKAVDPKRDGAVQRRMKNDLANGKVTGADIISLEMAVAAKGLYISNVPPLICS